MHVAGEDLLLVALPEGGVEERRVVRHEDLAHAGLPSRNGAKVSGKTSCGPTWYQTSPDISSSSFCASGTLRKLQSVRYSISS
jgi:hypothetical protein